MTAWDPHLVEVADLGPELGEASSFADRIAAFLAWQTARWPRLAEARAALAAVRVRPVQVAGRTLALQWNPGRAVSTTAKVDPAAVAQRPCFLCPQNLPTEEAGLAWGPSWVVLPNPAPILDRHLVIAHRDHTPQDVTRAVEPLIGFAHQTAGTMTALYNGPRSGASAPDHLHLQAVAAGTLPEEQLVRAAIARGEVPGTVLHWGARGVAWTADDAGRSIVGFAGDPTWVRTELEAAIAALGSVTSPSVGVEPQLNLLATGLGDGRVAALLFPRGAHRPAVFFADGPTQRVISPGIIDMAGTVVAVREQDFDALDGPQLAAIFGEVTLSAADRAAFEAKLSRRWSDG
ncbi:MAG: DUF4922 domain-containing protein [Myxococcota bacterium]